MTAARRRQGRRREIDAWRGSWSWIPGGSYGASMTVVLQLGDAHAPEYMAMHEPLAPSLPCKGRVAASAASSRVGSATRSAPHPAACGGHPPPLGEGWSKRRVTSTTTSAVIPLA